MLTTEVKKKVTLQLVGLDGNSFALMAAFKRQAQKENWTIGEIEAVIDECQTGDYHHLLNTLMKFTKAPVEESADELEQENEQSEEKEHDLEDDEEDAADQMEEVI